APRRRPGRRERRAAPALVVDAGHLRRRLACDVGAVALTVEDRRAELVAVDLAPAGLQELAARVLAELLDVGIGPQRHGDSAAAAAARVRDVVVVRELVVDRGGGYELVAVGLSGALDRVIDRLAPPHGLVGPPHADLL